MTSSVPSPPLHKKKPPEVSASPPAPPPLPPKPDDLRAPALPQLPPRHPSTGHRRSKSVSTVPSSSYLLAPPPLPPRPITARDESTKQSGVSDVGAISGLLLALHPGQETEGHGNDERLRAHEDADSNVRKDDLATAALESELDKADKYKAPPLPPRPHQSGTRVTLDGLQAIKRDDVRFSQDLPTAVSSVGQVLGKEAFSIDKGRKGNVVEQKGTDRNGPSLEGRKVLADSKMGRTPVIRRDGLLVPFPTPHIDFRLGVKLDAESMKFIENAENDLFCLVDVAFNATEEPEDIYHMDLQNFAYSPYDDREKIFSREEVEKIQESLVSPCEGQGEDAESTQRTRAIAAKRIVEYILDKFCDGRSEDAEFMVDVIVRKLLEQGVLSRVVESLQKTNERDARLWERAVSCSLGVISAGRDFGNSLSLLALFVLGRKVTSTTHPSVERLLVGRYFCGAAGLSVNAACPSIRSDVDVESLYGVIGGTEGLLDLFTTMRSEETRRNLFHLILEVAVSRALLKADQEKTTDDKARQILWLGSIFRSYRLHEAFRMLLKHPCSTFVLDCVRLMFFKPLGVLKLDVNTEERGHYEAVAAANRLIDKGFALDVLEELELITSDYLTSHANHPSVQRYGELYGELQRFMRECQAHTLSESFEKEHLLRVALMRAIDETEVGGSTVSGALEIAEMLLWFILLPAYEGDSEIDSEPLAFLHGQRRVLRSTVSCLGSSVFVKLIDALAPQCELRYISEMRQALVELLLMSGDSHPRELLGFADDEDEAVSKRVERFLAHERNSQDGHCESQSSERAQDR